MRAEWPGTPVPIAVPGAAPVAVPGAAPFPLDRGDAPAVVTDDGHRVSYRELADRVLRRAEALGSRRRLVLVAAENDLDSLVTYLAALHGGHPALLAPPRPATMSRLVAGFDPDVVAEGATLAERRAGTRHDLHPELGLLLCTSGSTGSPKLVRLSAAGLVANAAAIGDYLGIADTDRAAVNLPMHYCYGLSVINSNLLRGATLLLTERSVTDPEFWSGLRAEGGTSLCGVPYTFELLDEVGFPGMELPALRYVTQAGGRLAPAQVRRYAELGARRGWRFFVMYGQTEATARMAYLPPELATRAPGAIGVPIPGGSFEVDPGPEAGAGTDEGELVYRGPNVMLGYAERPSDLALGRTVTELRTGDIGRRRPDGLYEVTGRRQRIIKPFGLRIDLDHLERLLTDEGCAAACVGDDEELVVAVASRGPDPGAVRDLVTRRAGLPADRVRVVPVPGIPRLPNGKIDHAAVSRRSAARAPRWPGRRRARRGRGRPRTVRDVFRLVFPLPELPDDATFVGLGGDSLTYVRTTVELNRLLGRLPADWPNLTIAELERTRSPATGWPRMEAAVPLRAAAIVLVVCAHVGALDVVGGAHLLLVISGWAIARFTLAPPGDDGASRALLRAATRVAVPTVAWVAWRAWAADDVDLVNALLLNYVVDPSRWGYWFVESLCQILLVLAALFTIPAIRRAHRRWPFPFAVGLLLVALVGRAFPQLDNEFSHRLMSPHLVLWLFVLGWVVQLSTTPGRRAVTTMLALALVPTFFVEPSRTVLVIAGVLLMLYLPAVPVPRAALRPLGALAGASLAIYLTHYAVFPTLEMWLPDPVVVVCCLVVGLLADRSVTASLRSLAAWRGRLLTNSS